MMMTENSGTWANQSTGWNPKVRAIQAKSPLTGCMSMFFHTSADTVGMTKNGAMTRRRTMPCPNMG